MKLLLPLLFILAGCPRPGTAPGSRIVECGKAAITQCAAHALPAVASCLEGARDESACLLGLIEPVGCLAFESVSCAVARKAEPPAAALGDKMDVARDEFVRARAKRWLAEQRVVVR